MVILRGCFLFASSRQIGSRAEAAPGAGDNGDPNIVVVTNFGNGFVQSGL